MKIFIRKGHEILTNGNKTSANDSPASGTISEWDVINQYASLLAYNLMKAGHEVKVYRADNTYSNKRDALNAGIAAAETFEADLFISCHCNAYDGSVTGTEVLYYNPGFEKDLASAISSNISSYLGTNNRGAAYRDNKGELLYTSMPAVIIEPFFCDTTIDTQKYLSKSAQGLANTITSAVLNTI